MKIAEGKRPLFILSLVLCMFLAACPANANDYFVDPNGNDTTGDGSIGSPYKTIGKAVIVVSAGDTIYVRAGTYSYTGSSTAITLPAKSGSSETNRCSLMGYNDERPLLNFSAITGTSAEGLSITGSYWYVKGIDCKGAPHNGIRVTGTYNIVEFCRSYENRNTGVGVAGGAAYNQIINCDSYRNCDTAASPIGKDADGFAPKMDVGTGNYFYGCRSWQNSDDAYDGYLRGADNVNTTYENCWAFECGWYWLDGSTNDSMNGNGFKMGGSDDKLLRHNVILKNCLAFQNKVKGFDQNNDKGDMTLYNCTAFNNGGNNFSIPSALASGKTAIVTNCLYYLGSISLGGFVVQTTNSWQGFSVSSADFASIDPSAAYGQRKADGSLPDITFMHLAAGSDLIDGGTDVGLPYNGSKPDLGCFETGGVSPPGAASNPTPTNGATDVGLNQDLSWTAGAGAASHDVYFGTDSTPDATEFKGNQAGTTYDPGTLSYNTTYYWRIDEKNAGGTTAGTVWSFTTMADTTPPEAPTGLTVILPGEANVPLDWNDNSEGDLAGYNIYRSETSGSGYSKLNGSLLTSSDYTDNITTHDTTYYYVVTAVDTSSNESDSSGEVFGGLYGDFTGNGIVEIDDLPDFLDYWLEDDCNETAGLDLDDNCIINFYEFAVLAENWLKEE